MQKTIWTLLLLVLTTQIASADKNSTGLLLQGEQYAIYGNSNFRSVKFESINKAATLVIECQSNHDLRALLIFSSKEAIEPFSRAIISVGVAENPVTFVATMHRQDAQSVIALLNPDHLREVP